jgi:hypothetical protein
MKRFLVALLVVLSLLLITPTVYGQVDVTPETISARCSSDGCVLLWKVYIQNKTNASIAGNLIIILTDKENNVITSFNMGPVFLKGSEFKVSAGVILMENSERTKSIKHLTAIVTGVVHFMQVNNKFILKF